MHAESNSTWTDAVILCFQAPSWQSSGWSLQNHEKIQDTRVQTSTRIRHRLNIKQKRYCTENFLGRTQSESGIVITQFPVTLQPASADLSVPSAAYQEQSSVCLKSSHVLGCISGYVEFPRTDNTKTRRTYVRLSIQAYYLPNYDNTFLCNFTGSRRNSELIINTNNIILKVINDNFSTLRFTSVFKVVLHCFTFCVQCLLGGHHPPECTDAHQLRITTRSVSSEMLTIGSCMVSFSAFKSTQDVSCTLRCSNNSTHTHKIRCC